MDTMRAERTGEFDNAKFPNEPELGSSLHRNRAYQPAVLRAVADTQNCQTNPRILAPNLPYLSANDHDTPKLRYLPQLTEFAGVIRRRIRRYTEGTEVL